MLMLVSCSKQGLFRSHVLGQGKCEYQEGVAIVTQRERPRARKGLVSVVILPPIDPSTGTDYSPINQSTIHPTTAPGESWNGPVQCARRERSASQSAPAY